MALKEDDPSCISDEFPTGVASFRGDFWDPGRKFVASRAAISALAQPCK